MKEKKVVLMNPNDNTIQVTVNITIDSALKKELVLPKHIIDALDLVQVDHIAYQQVGGRAKWVYQDVDGKSKYGNAFYGFVQMWWNDVLCDVPVLVGADGSKPVIGRKGIALILGLRADVGKWGPFFSIISAVFGPLWGMAYLNGVVPLFREVILGQEISSYAYSTAYLLFALFMGVLGVIGGPIFAWWLYQDYRDERVEVQKLDDYFKN